VLLEAFGVALAFVVVPGRELGLPLLVEC